MLLGKDIYPKIVQELFGHAALTLMLDTYAHVPPRVAQSGDIDVQAENVKTTAANAQKIVSLDKITVAATARAGQAEPARDPQRPHLRSSKERGI